MNAAADPLPDHWYIFFGILEPISVLAGCIYATFLPTRYNHELIPPAFLPSSKLQSSLLNAGVLVDPASRMALGQLGSCYFLIMLNSALVFYALRKNLRGKNNVALENTLKYLFVVLAAADWTHIGITILLLPNGPPKHSGLIALRSSTFLDKLTLLSNPQNWNSLLFGNIIITFILFCFRALWWVGVARGSPSKSVATSAAKTKTATKKQL